LNALLSGVVDLLAGQPNHDLLDALAQLRADARQEALQRFPPELRARLDGLEDRYRCRILDAPAMWQLLMLPADDDVARLADWIDVEEAFGGGATSTEDQQGWSALGDCCLPTGSNGDAIPPAPVLAIGALIDWRSPNALGPLPEIAGDSVPFADADAERALDRLRAADDVLAHPGMESWRELVRRHTAVVVFRNDPISPGFSSCATRFAIRRPVFRNPHAPDADPADLLDGWVHESVHAVLDTVELVRPFVDTCSAEPACVRSGWSGNLLDVDTYVHATLVWFALWHLWADVLRRGAMPEEVAIPMLIRASRGFATPDQPELPPVLAPGVADTLRDARARVAANLVVAVSG
jgi:cytochrome c553